MARGKPAVATKTRASAPESKPAEAAEPKLTTREHIIRSAAELFAASGYHGTGIAEILDAVGLSRGTLYYHVDSKETLLFEICRNQVRLMNEVADEVLTSTASGTDKMRHLARSLLRNIAEHDAEWTVFFREFGALGGERRTEILEARDHYERVWVQTLDDAAASDEFVRARVSSLQVKGILGMLNYTYLWIDPSGKYGPEEIADLFVDLLLNGLLPRG